jgi:hypothetical protein
MKRNQEKEIADGAKSNEEKSVNISDLEDSEEQKGLPCDEPIKQSKWVHDLDILNEAEISEEQSIAYSYPQSSTPHSLNHMGLTGAILRD